jgi:cellulose synthase/poly-beta-1,6-N-acetylglucosamine synthase-like glycosyltransferase
MSTSRYDGTRFLDTDRLENACVIARVLVVVPVRDEERLLPACLTALARAAERVDVPVRIQLVLDACTDASARVPASNVEVMEIDERNVGAARSLGFAETGATCGPETWFATTDADSEVDDSWLRAQLGYARNGTDVVAGVVGVRSWGDHPAAVRRAYEKQYRTTRAHGHVHGANLGFRADAYWRIGGFRHLHTGEDIEVVARMIAAGARVTWADDVVVTTSARRIGRAPHGFADHIGRIERAVNPHRKESRSA